MDHYYLGKMQCFKIFLDGINLDYVPCVDGKLLHLCSVQIENVTFHHEGFFWRCWFNGIVEENDSNIWQFWYSKCISALFPCLALK